MTKKGCKFVAVMPPMTCEECSSDYNDWEVPPEDWALLPQKYRKEKLCEACYLEILKKKGYHVSKIKITHDSWKRKKAMFSETQDFPMDMMHIHISFSEAEQKKHGLPAGETMWCKLLMTRNKELTKMIVEVQNTSIFLDLVYGDIATVTWDKQTFHGITGRPMFEFQDIIEKKGQRTNEEKTLLKNTPKCDSRLEVDTLPGG